MSKANMDMKIRIKYFTDVEPIKFIGDNISDWIDLRAAETVSLKAGDFKLIVQARSKTMESFRLILLR